MFHLHLVRILLNEIKQIVIVKVLFPLLLLPFNHIYFISLTYYVDGQSVIFIPKQFYILYGNLCFSTLGSLNFTVFVYKSILI